MRNLHLDHENRPRKYGLTAEDQQKLRDSYFEKKRVQQAEADLALVKAVELGAKLKALKDS